MATTPNQRRAAALLGAGHSVKDAASEVGVSAKTVGRWAKRPDMRALIRSHREALLPDGAPTAEQVLVQALSATRRSGEPDWQTRVAAAKALLSAPAASKDAEDKARRTERIYVAPDERSAGAEEEPDADAA